MLEGEDGGGGGDAHTQSKRSLGRVHGSRTTASYESPPLAVRRIAFGREHEGANRGGCFAVAPHGTMKRRAASRQWR